MVKPNRFPRGALAAGLLLAGCATTPAPTDGHDDAGAPDAGAAPTGRTPLAGWEGKLTTWDLASTVEGIASRSVTVLVPPGYDDAAAAQRRYPALYMHDGQNCLDRDPFNHGGWQVHTIAHDLISRGVMAPAIVVMVDNTDRRAAEYVPSLSSGATTADAYLDFLQNDVIPFVDRTYRTIPDAAHRGLGGSSYGGIISLYGAWTRPSVWTHILAMSPAFAYDFHALVTEKKPLRIYLDSGTVDWGGGDDGKAKTERLRDLLIANGWALDVDLKHHVGVGHNHSEDFWRARLPIALPFVFPPG